MTSQPAKSIASMSALVTQLNMSEPKNWLLADLPAEAQAYIAHDRIFWFEGLDKGNFDLDQFKDLHTANGEYHYVWIEVGQDDKIIVVGRTKFDPQTSDRGDLFRSYRVHLDKSGDEIARLQYGDDYDAEVTDLFEAIETKINAYVKGAVVIPLDVATTADVHQLESEIGDAVVSKYGALNPNSHHIGRETIVVADEA
ncbi:hypothetical protein P4G57_12670 [Lacticaseibacillus paracasei]|jgi:hypothetical protein|uniref:Uncharacterized protein n=3 Tax=Lacticaseibacillus paracasei TaxID=1597 RepID=A0AAP4N5K5_LACPA|nr:hypothetical protein [Lacticaseibacillus paracasei]NMN63691.1 hypothetical protein [Lacticaseibacillus casei]NMN66808.1 hypothetical protein [Lacticaseibacillus casei CRF28]EKQ09331.1 hypothetical protein LCACRF28_2174 [Lacticaseibacillus paracasei]EPC15816.1 hypothetical protein Lpp122_2546 [Lacticaseibacillus paracasei subsp. paracasei Lpp122]MDE5159013.1 hypothetical protein [Lacticaseibacillus paracasei]